MKTVLAVDDSRSLRQMVTFSLKTAGYQVTEAEDGVEGLALAKKQVFDVVLTVHWKALSQRGYLCAYPSDIFSIIRII